MKCTMEKNIYLDFGTALEYIQVEICRINNMLSIFDEQIEREIAFLKKSDDGCAQYFVSRYDILRSLMEVMQINFCDTIESIGLQIDANYEAAKKASPMPSETE